jgi:hypothetical protein
MLFYNIKIKKRTSDGLLVNQLAAQAEAAEAEEAANVETVDTSETEGQQPAAPMEETAVADAPAEEPVNTSPAKTEEEVRLDGTEN